MFVTCLIVFLAKAVELTVESIRVMYLVKRDKLRTSLLSFVDVMIGLYALRDYTQTQDRWHAFLIAVCYSAGYAAGSYMGLWLFEWWQNRKGQRHDKEGRDRDGGYQRKSEG